MAEKRNIFLVGPMGAGKSTIGRQLAQQLNMDFVDSDAVIEERAGADISWIFDLEGEEGFRKRATSSKERSPNCSDNTAAIIVPAATASPCNQFP